MVCVDVAKEKLAESHHAHAIADRLDFGELGVEISLVLCSIAVLTMCRRPEVTPKGARPRIARLLLSVAPLVKITSSRLAPTTAPTWSRAFCTACLARAPY